ncbi:MAG: hypothetical protein Q4A18_04385 [Rikenellaceae bacterium]|nr:hypothetical protein [Rikenellaceae bacterium]
MKKHFYEAPELEQIELAVEAGFATSNEDYDEGGDVFPTSY